MQAIAKVKAFNCDTLDAAKQRQLQNAHKRLLMEASKQPLGVEVGRVFDLDMQPLTGNITGNAEGHSVKLPNFDTPYIVIHTHPASGIFSHGDLKSFIKNENLKLMTALGHSGHIFAIEKTSAYDFAAADKIIKMLYEQILVMADTPRKKLSDADLLTRAAGLVESSLKELEAHGIKFYR